MIMSLVLLLVESKFNVVKWWATLHREIVVNWKGTALTAVPVRTCTPAYDWNRLVNLAQSKTRFVEPAVV